METSPLPPSRRGNVGRKQGFCSYKSIFEVRNSPSGRGLGGGFQKEVIIITAIYKGNSL